MKAQVILFTSPTCGFCPQAKRIIEELTTERSDFDLTIADGFTPHSQKLARAFHIISVPTFIIQGPRYHGNIGLQGIQTKDVLHKYIDIAVGKQQLEETPTLKDKLKKFLTKSHTKAH